MSKIKLCIEFICKRVYNGFTLFKRDYTKNEDYNLKRRIKLTFGEEIANAVTHGVPVIIILLLVPLTAVYVWERAGRLAGGAIADVAGITIFNFSMIFMFLMSALYHSMEHDSKQKSVLHILDHIGIFVAIAGSYTPIAISVLGGWRAVVVLVIQWALVIFGVLIKSLAHRKAPKASLALYLLMGWTVLFFFPAFYQKATPYLFWLVTSGGLLYTVGAVFYAVRGFKFWHMVFHLFVLFGAAAQYIGICFFLF